MEILPQINQYFLKTKPSSIQHDTPDSDQSSKEKTREYNKIICRECGFQITAKSFAININGSHEHSFFNPGGYVFQIKCFSTAIGSSSIGEPSSEFSWFSGYTWKIAICKNCLKHLGWKFQGSNYSFFGLIKNNILDDNK
ncbi:cereblon family protein [Maridesulfovibrio zosterae]|uniref:cereblon family protein n=1 Tax=Maridesulfovibrio zosterae TaxID=82171 RepID=UPI0004191BDE|nr:cereblon family protein [Maridesulfovibrio zosterae]